MIPVKFKIWYDGVFRMGMVKGDIFWFLDRTLRKHSANWSHFILTVYAVAFDVFEITGQIAMLSYHPSIDDVLQFAPMFFVSLHVCFASLPLLIQRYSYIKLYESYKKMWPLNQADYTALEKLRALFKRGMVCISFYVVLNVCAGFGYFPFGGVDYYKTGFPVVGSARLVENGPAYIRHLLILLNFGVIFPKGYFLTFYGIHLMHICLLYTSQNVLLRMRLRNITYEHIKMDCFPLLQNNEYQNYVKQELIECVRLDVKLKLFCVDIKHYFGWVLLIHTGSAVICLTSLLYINVFLGGGFSPTSARIFLFAGSLTVFLYTYCSEMFTEQVGLTRNAVFETPWYTFDVKNRKIVAIFLTNLVQERSIYAGGLFRVDFSLLIWIFHKVFSLFTVISKLAITEVQLK